MSQRHCFTGLAVVVTTQRLDGAETDASVDCSGWSSAMKVGFVHCADDELERQRWTQAFGGVEALSGGSDEAKTSTAVATSF